MSYGEFVAGGPERRDAIMVARPRPLSCATRARESCSVSTLIASSRSVCSMVEQGDGGGKESLSYGDPGAPPLKPKI